MDINTRRAGDIKPPPRNRTSNSQGNSWNIPIPYPAVRSHGVIDWNRTPRRVPRFQIIKFIKCTGVGTFLGTFLWVTCRTCNP
eukprot:3193012-Pyramimonas_sp.AAC.1